MRPALAASKVRMDCGEPREEIARRRIDACMRPAPAARTTLMNCGEPPDAVAVVVRAGAKIQRPVEHSHLEDG
jgi:hypothetical protein